MNQYLSLLSDIILENGGTIDKYEGDAIIAFVGAPVSYEDHAWRAVISAVRMKQAEAKFNEEMIANGTIPLHGEREKAPLSVIVFMRLF